MKHNNTWKQYLLVFVGLLATISIFAHTDSLTDDIIFSVPTQKQLSLIYELEDHCLEVSDPPYFLGQSCIDKLTQYFADKPIWHTAMMWVHYGGRARASGLVFGDREHYLRFSPTEILADGVPTWNDIFDGNIRDRIITVANVLEDEVCQDLKEFGPIKSYLSDRCESRELYKYATYLDACMTGFSRSSYLHGTRGTVDTSLYQTIRKDIDPEHPVNEIKGNSWQLVEKYLHALWITDRCSNMEFVPFDENLNSVNASSINGTFDDMIKMLAPVHDVVLAISARSGDSWSISSFYEKGLGADIDYWKSLYRVNPLLFHRWMASDIGNLWFEDDDQALHALRAYNLEKATVQEVAELEPEQYFRQRQLGTLVKSLENLELSETQDWNSLKYPWDVVEEEEDVEKWDRLRDTVQNMKR